MKTTTKYKYDAKFENALKNDRTSYSLKQALLNGFISCYTNNPVVPVSVQSVVQ